MPAARDDLRRARMAAGVVYGGFILVVLLGASIIIASHQANISQVQTPTSVTTTSPLTPAATRPHG